MIAHSFIPSKFHNRAKGPQDAMHQKAISTFALAFLFVCMDAIVLSSMKPSALIKQQ